ncbi:MULTISPECIES: hypothetical protein [unclassified Pannonibacter]|uniref:hypothetical protein n=1 Tax=unclassified Pannonibacter TaxID=2627228 RepID=UPI0016471DE2|nr:MULTISPECIES: hypothetical protein [unclassified Pannonibacter]
MSAASRQRRARERRERHASSYQAEAIAFSDLVDDILGTLEQFLENVPTNTAPDQADIIRSLSVMVKENRETQRGIDELFIEIRKEIEDRLPLR